MNTFQQMTAKPGFRTYKQALEVLSEKVEMYYGKRITDAYQEVSSRWNNDSAMLEWANGEAERFNSDMSFDLSQISAAAQYMAEKKVTAYPGKLQLRSTHQLQWDGMNLVWRVV